VAVDTRPVISFLSPQHEIDAVSFYYGFAFNFMSYILLFLNLVYVPVIQVFITFGSVVTELAETGAKSCHVQRAGTPFLLTLSLVI
jgi:predicted membrane metal-binding protein